MKWNRFVFSTITLLCTMQATAVVGDVSERCEPSVVGDASERCDPSVVGNASERCEPSDSIQQTKYEQRMLRNQQLWASLIPTTFVIQNAGNMGVLSAGIGWSYGKRRQWETDLLFGYIPKHDSSRGKLTTTLKGNYIPWRIDLASLTAKMPEERWYFEPLTTSLYINTVYGHEFWKSQPGRYPDKYYEFMSTKFRLNIAIGERITFKIPENKRRRHSRISLFYEVGTCDLYVRSMFQDGSVKLSDILGLSIGLKFYTL